MSACGPRRSWETSGFARALDDRRLILAADPPVGDPLEAALAHARIGVLAIEFATRLRIRLNGVAERTPDGIVLTVEEAFGNARSSSSAASRSAGSSPPPRHATKSGTRWIRTR